MSDSIIVDAYVGWPGNQAFGETGCDTAEEGVVECSFQGTGDGIDEQKGREQHKILLP